MSLHSDPKRQQQVFRGEVWTDDAGRSRFGHLVTRMPTAFQRGRNLLRGIDVRTLLVFRSVLTTLNKQLKISTFASKRKNMKKETQ